MSTSLRIAEVADRDECGPIQNRWRTLVADTLTAAQAEIVEIETLISDLRHAAVALEHHRPLGRCDDECGCISETTTTRRALCAEPTATTSEATPIARTLGAEQIPRRLDDWNAMLGGVVTRSAIPGGVRLVLADQVDIAPLARLASGEQDCCGLCSFRIGIEHSGATLDLIARDDALDVVNAMFGARA